MKCLLFHYVYPKRVTVAAIWIKSSIFPNGIRPPSGLFYLNIGFPQQVFRIPSEISTWPARNNASDTYSIDIRLSRIEVIKRRRKRGSDCHDWDKYDSIVQDNILSEVGCRPVSYTHLRAHET